MVNILKQHWPFVIMLALVVFFCISFKTYAPQDTGAGIVIAYIGFVLALPICSFILSLWYGYKLTSVFKWLIVIACACPGIVLVAIMSKDFKVWDYWQMGVFSFVGALAGMILGCLIKLVKNQIEKRRVDLT